MTCFFPSGVTFRVFISYFVFSLTNKTKISDDSKSFSKNHNFSQTNKKVSHAIEWERIKQNTGSIDHHLGNNELCNRALEIIRLYMGKKRM